ncbi:MAG: NUDIX domain-containing protein [Pseudomonadota bacterium]
MSTYRYCPVCAAPLVPQEHGGKTRAACSDARCHFVHWDNPTPVVAAVAERNGCVIQVRSIGWPDGWFGLVTGFLEAGEMPEEAVLREVEEETGLSATMGGYIGMYPFYRMNQLIIAYHVHVSEGDVVLDRTELEDYREVPLDELVPWDSGTGKALRDWLATQGRVITDEDLLKRRR